VGIREKIEKHQPLVIGILSVVIIIAIISIVMQASNSNSSKAQVYYTIDDGQTLFSDSNMKIAPFEKDGKQAVRAHVFMCGGKKVVGYLSKYTDEALQILEEVKQAKKEKRVPKNIGALMSLNSTGVLVKKPGAGNPWVKGADMQKQSAIRVFRCPGEKEAAKEVDP
jgi:hypothetical protein